MHVDTIHITAHRETASPRQSGHHQLWLAEKPVRVTLIGDDELTARGLTSMLREHPRHIELVRMPGPGTEAVDIALYDPAVTRAGRVPTLAQILADARIRKVVLFTWNFQPWAASDLIAQGASAYLSKGLTSAELVQALRRVHSGPGLVSDTASPHPHFSNHAERGEVLTTREAQVLSLIAKGHSNTEIAATLNLSLNTVKSYIRTCYRKIDVESRSRAVLWGLSHGFGDSPSAASLRTTCETSASQT